MDFFEAQARAKRRTTRLVVLFVLAVLGTIAAAYAAVVAILHQVGASQGQPYSAQAYGGVAWWQPQLLLGIAAATVAAVALGSLSKWQALRSGGSAVAEMLGGRRVDPRTTDRHERQLLNIVEEMAIASGTPLPAVFVMDQEPAINAFAAGLTTSDAAVAVTRGTLQRLTRDELQGVIAHEFSHILNGDMRLNLRLTSVIFGLLVIAFIGRGLVQSLRWAGRGRSRAGRKNGGGILLVLVLLGVALVVIGYIGHLFGRLIQAAVSRQREYLADAAAVQFTRYPSGIANALKKIGGLALGGRLATPAAAQFNHAFFAQNFRSGLTGWYATHPSLPERIRAIEPGFDGTFLEPPMVVDVAKESFRTAGLGPAQAARFRQEPPRPGHRVAVEPKALAHTVGLPTIAHVERAQELLASVPPALRAAAADTGGAPAVVYALLLDGDGRIRERQREHVALLHPGAAPALDALAPLTAALPPSARLPLLQLTLEPLNHLAGDEHQQLLATIEALVRADARVSTFEYALRQVILHHLRTARHPTLAGEQIFSFTALAPQMAVILSSLAHASSKDPTAVQHAFAAGARELRMLEPPLTLLAREACGVDALDTALQQLARGSLPLKRRLLHAGCQVVAVDGTVGDTETELLRAVCAVLDCPMPPVLGRSVS